TSGIHAIALSPNEHRLVTVGYDQIIRVWDARSGKCLQTLEGRQGVMYSAAYAPDCRQFATGGGTGAICVWDAETYRLKHRLPSNYTHLQQLFFLPDGEHLIAAGDPGLLCIWDLSKKTPTVVKRRFPFEYITLSQDGKVVACLGRN